MSIRKNFQILKASQHRYRLLCSLASCMESIHPESRGPLNGTEEEPWTWVGETLDQRQRSRCYYSKGHKMAAENSLPKVMD